MKRLVTTLLLTCALSPAAFADSVTAQKLATVTNDQDQEVAELSILLDSSGKPTGLNITTHNSPDGKDINKNVSLAELASADGALMLQARGYNAIYLKGTLSPSATDAQLTVRYLTNALSSTYSSCDVEAKLDGSAGWELINDQSHAVITEGKVLTGTFGISKIQGICD